MFEEYLITHCSPTLASLKPASLFLYRFSSGEELYESVAVWDAQFQKKDPDHDPARRYRNCFDLCLQTGCYGS